MSALSSEQALPAPALEMVRLQPGDSAALDAKSLRVDRGRIEIYALLANRRRFLAEMPEGAWLLAGFPGLIAVAPEGATLTALDPENLAATAADALQAARIVPQIDAWIMALSEGLARLAPKRPDLRGIRAGDPLTPAGADAPAEPEGMSAAAGVVWIACAVPSLRFMGSGAADCGPLPVTSTAWVLRDAHAQASASSTFAVLRNHSLPSMLARFHGHVAGVLADSITGAEAAESARITAREAQTALELEETSSRLAKVLDERVTRLTPEPDDNSFVLKRLAPGITIPPRRTASLRAAADAAGVGVRTIVLSEGWWRRDHGRLAGKRLADGRPVALIPDWLGRYRIHARGEPALHVNAARAAELDHEVLALLPPLPNRPIRSWEVALLGLMLCRADLITLTIAGLAASLLGLALPLTMGMLIDNFVPSQLRGPTLLLGAALAMLTVCNGLLHAASDLARLRIDGRLSTQLQAGVIDRVLRLPSRLLRSFPSADLSLRILSIEQMRRTLTSVGLNTLLGGVFGISNLIVLSFYDLGAGAIAAALFVLLVVAATATGLMQLRALGIGETMTANIISQTLQMIQQVATLRAFGAEARAFVNWARNTASMRGRMLRSRRATIGFECFLSGYDVLGLAAIFATLGFSAASDGLSIGAYLAFVGVYQSFLFTSEGLARAVTQVLGMQPIIKRTALILGTAPENPPAAADPGTLTGAVEVSALTFAYGPDLPPVLNNVSLKVEPGQFVAIAGPSGCGKSTLMNLILGFDQPQSGTVLFDGRELSRLNRPAVRRQIGIVRQNGRLMAGSIYENILGLHPGTLKEAWEAAELAGIADDIRALPMGMHTILNEGVPTFSGGQIQRLLIARGLAGRPRILMLDEATSALDNRAQGTISGNIERLGITRIVVAHRLSTVRNANVIHFFEAGQIVESGTFDALMEADGRFASFTRRQFL